MGSLIGNAVAGPLLGISGNVQEYPLSEAAAEFRTGGIGGFSARQQLCERGEYHGKTTAPGHKIYPYLLRKLPITRPNQVWAMDITYIPMARGFIYLAAVLDWFTRHVLAWQASRAASSAAWTGLRS